jgi:hypothetical protein
MRIRSALLPLLLVFLGLSACNGASEGQPCVQDSDCSGSLVCRPSPDAPTTDGLRCCPSDISTATSPDCKPPSSAIFDAGSPAVPEGGYDTGAAVPEAGAESAADTGASVDSSDAAAPADAADATLPGDAADGAPATDGSGE